MRRCGCRPCGGRAQRTRRRRPACSTASRRRGCGTSALARGWRRWCGGCRGWALARSSSPTATARCSGRSWRRAARRGCLPTCSSGGRRLRRGAGTRSRTRPSFISEGPGLRAQRQAGAEWIPGPLQCSALEGFEGWGGWHRGAGGSCGSVLGGLRVHQCLTSAHCPALHRRACSLVGCQPGEAIHVGDSLVADVNGALQAGLAGGPACKRPCPRAVGMPAVRSPAASRRHTRRVHHLRAIAAHACWPPPPGHAQARLRLGPCDTRCGALCGAHSCVQQLTFTRPCPMQEPCG